MKTAEEMISPFVYGNYDNPDDASGLPEGDYIEESKCLMVMKEYAKQESDRKLREFKERLINEISEGDSIDTSYVYYAELVGLIENLK